MTKKLLPNLSPIITAEMNELLWDLRRLIEAMRLGGRDVREISLSDRQWHTVCKDKRRNDWRIPRSCGFIHYSDQPPTFDDVQLKPPSIHDLREYYQIDAFNALQDAARGRGP